MNGENIPDQSDDVIDVPLAPTPESGGSSAGRALAAVAAIVALILAAVFVVDRNGGTDVASDGPAEVSGDADADGDSTEGSTDGDAGESEESEPAEPVDAIEDVVDYAEDEAMDMVGDAMYAVDSTFGGIDQTIFDGERFVSIGYGIEGRTLRTSTDGITWDEQPFPGVSEEVNVYQLTGHNGLYAAVLETWPEGSWDEDYSPLDDPLTATYALVTSTDLKTWTRSELSIPQSEGRHLTPGGIALGDAGVVIAFSSYEEGPNELRMLIEAGILAESDWESFCGFDFQADSIDVQICDYSAYEDPGYEEPDYEEFERRYEEAETEEERIALEEEFEELFEEPGLEVIATLTPADAIYGEFRSLYEGEYTEIEQTVALVGPVDGPFTLTSLPGSSASNIVDTSDGFVMISNNNDGSPSASAVYGSVDGLVWTERATFESHAGQLVAVGDVLLILSYSDFGEAETLRSVDGGATWDAVEVTDLYGGHTQFVSGPAGVIAVTEGSSDAMSFEAPETPMVFTTSDGYVLTVPFDFDGDSSVTLAGPDGQIIHDIPVTDLNESDGNIENVVRENPITRNPTFLDPETGEDLVTFTEDDFAAADEVYESYEEPEYTREIRFSADGLTWTDVDDARLATASFDGYVAPVAVGDDEVIFSISTWNEPSEELFAFEMENREPTDAELEALEAWEMSGGGESIEYVRIELG